MRCDSLVVTASDDGAIEAAIRLARLRGGDERYRTVALVGADHGHTGMCRSAGGIPERQRGLGPLMPGFDHVPAGDIEALDRAIGEQTACVLLSPNDWTDGCRPLDPEFLRRAAACCRERDAVLVIDETRAGFAASGRPFSFREIADVKADGVVVAGGLFGGLPGGLLIASSRLTGTGVLDVDRFPLQTELARTTMAELAADGLLDTVGDLARPIATRLAESIGGFEFVRDLHVLGLTIGIESDLPSGEWVAGLRRFGVRVEAAGDHAVRMQLPLTITPEQTEELMRRTVAALEALEGQATVTSTDETSASP